MRSVPDRRVQIVREIDTCGLQCPGPILQLKQGMDHIQPGQAVRISVSDPAFGSDLEGWCHPTGNRLREKQLNKGVFTAVVEEGPVRRRYGTTGSRRYSNCCNRPAKDIFFLLGAEG